jgi:porphobilinogen deaminase
LRLLHGDCDLPVGAHARFIGDEMELIAQLFTDELAPKAARARGNNPEKLAREVFKIIKQDHEQ